MTYEFLVHSQSRLWIFKWKHEWKVVFGLSCAAYQFFITASCCYQCKHCN